MSEHVCTLFNTCGIENEIHILCKCKIYSAKLGYDEMCINTLRTKIITL